MSDVNQAFQTLDVAAMPLRGRHLIEASAGTGKTFNITRIYLRLLLEKKLTIQQILVMTFTKAATEEIRGRIGETLRDAVKLWHKVSADPSALEDVDAFFSGLYRIAPAEEGLQILEAAMLELDEASVFTIHGFCNHVLSQQAFASGSPMSLSLETDTSELWEQAAADWIRTLVVVPEKYALLTEKGWHVPGNFIGAFGKPLRGDLTPKYADAASIAENYESAITLLRHQFLPAFPHHLQAAQEVEPIVMGKIAGHKNEAQWREEWQAMMAYLSQGELLVAEKSVTDALNGSRGYMKDATAKPVLVAVKTFVTGLSDELKKVDALKEKNETLLPIHTLIADGFQYIRRHVAEAKRKLGIVDFDDLIRLLADKLDSEDSTLRTVLRQLYPVALVDEFQDTDACQYRVLSAVYPRSSDALTLMMIGDPKQAIYGFRGGDIFTYLQAGEGADYRWVMDTNWRSTANMVTAYNRVFHGAPLDKAPEDVFGYGIRYEKVNSTPHAKAAKEVFEDPAERRAMNYVVLEQEEGEPTTKPYLSRKLADWMSDEILRLLSDARFNGKPVEPADIAILVRSGAEADIVQRSLKRNNLGAVFLSTKTSLFASEEAGDLYRVLDGIWHSEQLARLSAALASPLLGYEHEKLVAMLHDEDDVLWEACMAEVSALRAMWGKQGCMAVVLTLLRQHFAVTDDNTERHLTNYMHLAEVLEKQASATPQPEQLLIWLHRQLESAGDNEEHIQRLESDARLIQLITQHGSKGLEYPIVFVPFASIYKDPGRANKSLMDFYQFNDPATRQQVLQLGHSEEAEALVRKEGEAEAMRLLYVAITRAAHRCYLGIAEFDNARKSSIATALGLTDAVNWHGAISKVEQEGEHTLFLPGHITPEATGERSIDGAPPALKLSQFTGTVEDAWRLYSFTALTRQQVAVKHTQRDEETADVVVETVAVNDTLPFRFTLEKGASAGNLLHDMLEVTDFSAPDWSESRSLANRLALTDEDYTQLCGWMNEVLSTPLNNGATEVCMHDLPLEHTLREAEFYFPVKQANWWALSRILTAHRQQVNGDNAQPVPKISRPMLEGMMHGFIDLIFEHDGKYYVADYKSTHLGNDMAHYQFAQLARNNQHHLYDLQYLLYALALHRYLKNGLQDYQPELHFGGVFYLYLRGMHPDNAHSEGVFYTPVDMATLVALDNAFNGESVEELS